MCVLCSLVAVLTLHASFMDMRTIQLIYPGIYELDGTHGKFQQGGGKKNLSGRGTTKKDPGRGTVFKT